MNFIYSFIKKPDHIFLVHGEPEAQDVLREKIEKETNIKIDAPEFGETYELSEDKVILTNKLERKITRTRGNETCVDVW